MNLEHLAGRIGAVLGEAAIQGNAMGVELESPAVSVGILLRTLNGVSYVLAEQQLPSPAVEALAAEL